MIKIIKTNLLFFVPYSIIMIACVFVLSLYSKAEIHIAVNQKYCEFGDFFFPLITHLGDGILIGVSTIVLLFIKYRFAIINLLTNLSAIALAQFLKRGPLDDLPRPRLYFREYYDGVYNLRFVPGVETGIWYPFPSGHTTTAFAIFTFLALITPAKYKMLKLVFLIVPCLVGYSRMYVSQHFLMDVTGGAFVGASFAVICYWIVIKINVNWIDQSILSLLRKKNENK